MRIEQHGQSIALLCACCDLPFARLQFGRLVIESKHHGATHTNALDIKSLKRILEALTDDSAIIPGVPTR